MKDLIAHSTSVSDTSPLVTQVVSYVRDSFALFVASNGAFPSPSGLPGSILPLPEPGTLLLLGIGLIVVGLILWKSKGKKNI